MTEIEAMRSQFAFRLFVQRKNMQERKSTIASKTGLTRGRIGQIETNTGPVPTLHEYEMMLRALGMTDQTNVQLAYQLSLENSDGR